MKWRPMIVCGLLWIGGIYPPVASAGGESPGGGASASLPEDAGGDQDTAAWHRRSQALEGNDPAKALQAARRGLEAARKQGDPSRILEALLQVGQMSRLTNDYTGALSCAAEGMALAQTRGNHRMRGEFFILTGMVKWNLADVPGAKANFLEARAISDKLGDLALRVGAESGLGLACARDDDHDESGIHLEAALRLAEEIHDPRLGTILNYLGNHYLATKEYGRAHECFERALTLVDDGRNQRLVAFLLLNLGEVADLTGDRELAISRLQAAMAICEQFGLRRGIADVHFLLARVERGLGRHDESLRHLDEGMRIALALDNPDLLVSFYQEYILTEEAQGRFREALAHSRLLAEQTEKIRGESSRQQAAEIEARYEVEARRRQVKLLQRDKELQQADLDLKSAELSRTQARYSALGLIVIFGAVIGAMFLARQRSRVRRTGRMLAETRVAKGLIEEAEARKSRLLDIATQDLSESEARFRNAFVHSPLGLAMVSLDGRWLRVNQALCQVIGYSEQELMATTFQAITHADDLQSDLDLVQRLLRGEIDSYDLDKRYIHRDGHLVWARLDVSLHRDPASGQPRYFISQVQDITARRRAEELLHLAKDEAEKANAAKNEFLSRMSHELRTPLNAILGFGQLLELQDLGASNNQGVGYILTAGRHLLSLINEVLDLSRIESGRFTFSLEPTPVDEVMRGSLEMMRPLAEEAGLCLNLVPCEDAGTILADPRRLKQVLINLLSNAIKYNRPKGRIEVRCVKMDGRLRIGVNDTGVGIAAADQARVFAPFARLPATQEIAGTGLGLSLSKALTEAMGGTLGVHGNPGVGSTFWVEFECVSAGPPVSEVLPAPVVDGLWTAPAGHATILYIEDDPANREVVELLLSLDDSIGLVTANDGTHGLAVAREQLPDLILLDLHLPDMDGAEVLPALRRDPVTAGIPVIVVSADATAEKIERMRQLGAQAYITKPFSLKSLRQSIDEVLRAAAYRSPRDVKNTDQAKDDQITGDDQVQIFGSHQHEHARDQRQQILG